MIIADGFLVGLGTVDNFYARALEVFALVRRFRHGGVCLLVNFYHCAQMGISWIFSPWMYHAFNDFGLFMHVLSCRQGAWMIVAATAKH